MNEKINIDPVDGVRIVESVSEFDFYEKEPKSFQGWFYEHHPNLYQFLIFQIPGYLREVQYLLQRWFRRHHMSDNQLYGFGPYMAKILLPKLKTLRALEVSQIPPDFYELAELPMVTLEQYEKARAEGKILGTGKVGWLETIEEMIYAFEFLLYHESGDKKQEAFYKKYGLVDPYAEVEDNAFWSYHCTNPTGDYVGCGPSDYERVKNDSRYVIHGKTKEYCNLKAIRQNWMRATKGLQLFGKYFWAL